MIQLLRCALILATWAIPVIFSLTDLSAAEDQQPELLKARLRTANPDEMAVLYNSIALEYLDTDLEFSLAYADTALRLATLQDQKRELVNAMNIKGMAWAEFGQYDSALAILHKAENRLDEIYDEELKINTMNALAEVYRDRKEVRKSIDYFYREMEIMYKLGDSSGLSKVSYDIAKSFDLQEKFDSAYFYYSQALKLAEGDEAGELVGDLQNRMGNIFLNWGNYKKALEHYLLSLKTFEALHDSVGISKAYNNIGVINHDWGNLEESLKYYSLSFLVDSLQDDYIGQSQTLNNIAILYDDMGNRKKAHHTYERSLMMAMEAGNNYQIAVTNSNLGGFYIEDKKYDLAEKYILRAISYYKKANSTIGVAESDILFGDLHYERGDYRNAAEHFLQGLDFAIEHKLPWTILNAYYGLARTYEATGNFKEALYYSNKYYNLNDSIFSTQASRQMALQSNAFEIQQKDQEMEIQTLRMAEQRSKINRQENIVFSLSAVIILFAIYTVVLIRQYRLRLKAWKQLLANHNELLQSRKELIAAKEKAEESDKLKSAFLVNLSHELRTPMNGIMGFTDLLQKNTASEEQRQTYLSYIASSSKQLLKVLNDIIDISAIETNQLELSLEACKLHDIMQDLHKYFEKEKNEVEKGHLEIVYEAPEDADAVVFLADRKRLAQVIFNLLSNAVAFTEEGRVSFGFRVLENERLRIHVLDTGIGIERSKYELIFDRFRQVDETTTRQYSGSGLGLAISRELLYLMKGSISLESEVGKGSTFYVEIPYKPLS